MYKSHLVTTEDTITQSQEMCGGVSTAVFQLRHVVLTWEDSNAYHSGQTLEHR